MSREIDRAVARAKKALPRGSRVIVRGQIETMRSSFQGLVAGLAFSIVLVYMLIVINFQSWLDPFIIISALPAALAGIVWFLFVTHTTVSVPALTGSIMCMGVATANSILVVSFAKEQLPDVDSAADAALLAGFTRFRPVLMTALRDDDRNASHGAGHWRRQRAECSARARGDRRAFVCDHGDFVFCSGILQPSARQAEGRMSKADAAFARYSRIACRSAGRGSGGGFRHHPAAAGAAGTSSSRPTVSAEPTVTMVHPQTEAPAEEVVLPGNIQAFIDAPIYARTNGYLKKWYFDIGAHVKQGQLLAEIESPEVDQQLQQAREDLATAQANLNLAQITANRYVNLFKTDSVAKQDVDNAVQDAAAKSARLSKSAQANVRRLEQWSLSRRSTRRSMA